MNNEYLFFVGIRSRRKGQRGWLEDVPFRYLPCFGFGVIGARGEELLHVGLTSSKETSGATFVFRRRCGSFVALCRTDVHTHFVGVSRGRFACGEDDTGVFGFA